MYGFACRKRQTRKLEVLDLVMAGKKNKDIADQLGITIRAVEDRRIRLMKKLQVDSLAELVELAIIFRRAKRDERFSGRLVRRTNQHVVLYEASKSGSQC